MGLSLFRTLGVCLVTAPLLLQAATSDKAQAISKAHFEFSLDLYKSLLADQGEANMVISPYSLHLSLSMLFLGTTSSSNSSRQLRSMMRFDGISYVDIHNEFKNIVATFDTNYYRTKMKNAHGLYVASDVTVAPPYDRALREFYHAHVEHMDFSNADPTMTKGLVNEFVEDVTDISETLDKVPAEDTRLLVIDAMSLATRWLFPFESSQTFQRGLFFPPNNQRYSTIPNYLEGNQNKNNYLVSNKLKFPTLFSVRNRWEKIAGNFNLS